MLGAIIGDVIGFTAGLTPVRAAMRIGPVGFALKTMEGVPAWSRLSAEVTDQALDAFFESLAALPRPGMAECLRIWRRGSGRCWTSV
jgi:hypothetical protein